MNYYQIAMLTVMWLAANLVAYLVHKDKVNTILGVFIMVLAVASDIFLLYFTTVKLFHWLGSL